MFLVNFIKKKIEENKSKKEEIIRLQEIEKARIEEEDRIRQAELIRMQEIEEVRKKEEERLRQEEIIRLQEIEKARIEEENRKYEEEQKRLEEIRINKINEFRRREQEELIRQQKSLERKKIEKARKKEEEKARKIEEEKLFQEKRERDRLEAVKLQREEFLEESKRIKLEAKMKIEKERKIKEEKQKKVQMNREKYAQYIGSEIRHRSSYIYDTGNKYTKIVLKDFTDIELICETNNGEKKFQIDSIGKNIYFSDMEVPKEVVLAGNNKDIPSNAKDYMRELSDDIYIKENNFCQKTVNILKNTLNTIKREILENRMVMNDFTDSRDIDLGHRNIQAMGAELSLTQTIKKPYFAKLHLDNYSVREFYIGSTAIKESSIPIIDWREKVSQLYYTKNPKQYEQYGVSLIRNIDIYNGNFCGYLDSYTKNKITKKTMIVDDFFLNIIQKQRNNNKLTDIIQTIQDIQYEIISESIERKLLIQGCAGSGKTMIMMHRISYLLYNAKNSSVANFIVITPNANLNLEMNELSQKLQLKSINKLTLNELVMTTIFKYIEYLGLDRNYKYFINMQNRLIDMDNLLTTNSINGKIFYKYNKYSFFQEYLEGFGEKSFLLSALQDYYIIDNSIKTREEFIKTYEKECSVLIENINLLLRYIDIENNNIKDEITNIKKNLKRYTEKIKEFLIKNEELNVDSFSIDDLISYNKSLKEPDDNKKLNDNQDKLYKFNEKLKNIVTIMRVFKAHNEEIVEKNIDLLKNEELLNYIQIFYNYWKLMEQMKKFVNGIDGEYIFNLWESYIKYIKSKENLDDSIIYEFELYLLLSMLYGRYGAISSEIKWMFIDEIQDYLNDQILLIEKVYSSPIMNYFGDLNQRISMLDIPYYLDNISNQCKRVDLSVNYRNANEITNYINEICSMKMIPIGLSGTSRKLTYKQLNNFKWKEYTGRNIIIVKSIKEFYQLIKMVPSDTQNDIIFRQNLNSINWDDQKCYVFPVLSIKGLEFTKVLVYSANMDKNEKYVACTRALNDLIVIESD